VKECNNWVPSSEPLGPCQRGITTLGDGGVGE
jgi:hypothetical protein